MAARGKGRNRNFRHRRGHSLTITRAEHHHQFPSDIFLSSSPIVRAMVVRVSLAVIATARYNWYYYYDIDLAIFRSCSRAILFPFARRGRARDASPANRTTFRDTTPSVSSNTMICQPVLPLRLKGGACKRITARKLNHVSRCTTPSVSSSNTNGLATRRSGGTHVSEQGWAYRTDRTQGMSLRVGNSARNNFPSPPPNTITRGTRKQ